LRLSKNIVILTPVARSIFNHILATFAAIIVFFRLFDPNSAINRVSNRDDEEIMGNVMLKFNNFSFPAHLVPAGFTNE